MPRSTILVTPGHSTGRDRDVRVAVSLPSAPWGGFEPDGRPETMPRATPIRREMRQTSTHEPLFLRELRRAFKQDWGIE